MANTEEAVAQGLLKIEAVKLRPQQPFIWASGWHSPIYCDNRKTLSYPEIRTLVRDAFVEKVQSLYPDAEVIAGVATGAIAQGALVADKMNLPMIYIRSKAKDHGMGNLIEGDLKKGQKVVVIEDLISTGGSSLKAVEAVREAGAQVLGMVAIFTYGFAVSTNAFKEHNVQLTTLSNYNALIDAALKAGYVHPSDVDALKEWRKSPETWGTN